VGESSEIYEAMREERRERATARRTESAIVFLELAHGGFKVRMLTEYHYRINERLDIYPTGTKWHDIKTGKRGFYRGPRKLKEFVEKVFAVAKGGG